MVPTKATRTAAHFAVGIFAAALTAKAGKGLGAVVLGALLGAAAHEMLDAPVAQLMANSGLQFLGGRRTRGSLAIHWPGSRISGRPYRPVAGSLSGPTDERSPCRVPLQSNITIQLNPYSVDAVTERGRLDGDPVLLGLRATTNGEEE